MRTFVSTDTLMHYGILGMKWGIRKDRKSKGTSKRSTKTSKVKASSNSDPANRKVSAAELFKLQKNALGHVTKVLSGEDKVTVKSTRKAVAKAEQHILGTSETPSTNFGPKAYRASKNTTRVILEEMSKVSASKMKSDPEYAKVVSMGYYLYTTALSNNRSSNI